MNKRTKPSDFGIVCPELNEKVTKTPRGQVQSEADGNHFSVGWPLPPAAGTLQLWCAREAVRDCRDMPQRRGEGC